MTARAGFGFDVQNRPKIPQSRFATNQKQQISNQNRTPFADITHQNEIIFEQPQRQPQNQSRNQRQNYFYSQFQQQNLRNDDFCDPVEHMFPADPPPKYQGFKFEPSKKIWFDTEIELEPLPLLGEIKW